MPWSHKACISTLPSPYQGQWKERTLFSLLQGPSSMLGQPDNPSSIRFFMQIEKHRGPHPPIQCPTVQISSCLMPPFLTDEDRHLFLDHILRIFAGAMATGVSSRLPGITILHSSAGWTIYNLAEGPTCFPERLRVK